MSEVIEDGQKFVGFEYKDVITSANRASFLIDGYKNFGWLIDGNVYSGVTPGIANPNASVILRLKRDRKILNKMELTRLQRNFEFCLKEIDHLEKSKTSKAIMYALTVGIVGMAFMAGSVFAVTAEPPKIVLCIILAIPAFTGCISPYFIYKEVEKKRAAITDPLIQEKHDEIFEICEKGNKLLYYQS